MTAPDPVAHQQAALLAMVRRHVASGDRYALVDFPDHSNVGDSAIWLGEIALLRGVTGRDPDYVCSWHDFDANALRRACPSGILFLHGGGNLGDIWPHHQRFRESLLVEMRDRRIVQLPQSIHFRAPDGARSFVAAAAAHPDFHLNVRDRRSLDWAARHLPGAVDLAPDSAFALGPQARAAADHDVLMLLRTDDERAPLDRQALAAVPGSVLCDWLEDDALPPRLAGDTQSTQYHRLASARVARGTALLSRGRRIVTDRLHAHILALLLGIPHVVLDNYYGKLAAYLDAWTGAAPSVRRAGDAADAVAALG